MMIAIIAVSVTLVVMLVTLHKRVNWTEVLSELTSYTIRQSTDTGQINAREKNK